MRKGIGVSPGVAVGKAYCIHEVFVKPDGKRLNGNEVAAELTRFERALKKTSAELRSLARKVSSQVGSQQAEVFRAHQAIVRDPAFGTKIRNWIGEERQPAEAALHQVLNDYSSLFARTKDAYLKDRLNDVREVILRLSQHLSPMLSTEAPVDGPIVLVAQELLPSQVSVIGRRELAGIVTQGGGATSHAAILARSRGIPAVAGVAGMLKQVKNGDTVVVDGRDGHVIVNPDAETESAYRKLQREFFDLKDSLAENRDQPAVTADGQPVELLANINGLEDARAAVAMGAAGVGLFRTEYLFLAHPSVPDEEEQFEAYRQIVAASPPGQVTIRTLDLGGDKTIPYLGREREANPFMGWRSIRLSFEHPGFFMTQISAILRAAADQRDRRQVRMMFPMIATLEEIRRVRSMVHRARRRLEAAGCEVGDVPIGLMLEVPAAAISIRSLLKVVDFVSIGSNDLVQYLMAADRDNPKVSHLCQPLSPAVLRLLAKVIEACGEAKKPVTLCGEMAGQPRAFVLLYAMGLRSFSMSPAFIPMIKELASHLTAERTDRIYRHAMKLKSTAQVLHYMSQQLDQLAPNLKLMNSA
ncbi:MAG TPA: phosphoenolpyruvate--protein phosphotransferase [Pirellulales bacterium]|nr:phosphoenolpyruvate--protein phosphotransferase [Pirellulales bacterium]